MKKILLLAAGVGVLWFQSCSEVGPSIDLGPAAEDSAFTADVETAQTKKVVAEEFTGVSCPPCAAGHRSMKNISEALNGNLIIIGYHINGFPQAAPVEKDGAQLSKYDFRTVDATEVGKTIFGGVGVMPIAGFGRVPIGGELAVSAQSWSKAAEDNAAIPTPLNIHITSSYDADKKEATVMVKVAYTQEVMMKQNLTLLILEDSIVDAQKDGLDIVKEYTHKHVLRDIVTPINGSSIDKADPKVPGKVYVRTFTVPISDDWYAKNCHVVAFVNNNDASDRSIVHGAEAKLMQ